MPTIELETLINAPIDHVYAVARNLETFPTYMPDVESVKVVERNDDTGRIVADWVGLIPEFKQKIRWTEEDIWNDQERSCSFRQLKGEYKEFSGVWQFTSTSSGTLFRSSLVYDIEIPLIGPLIKKLVAKKMHDNISQILNAIKARAERAPS